MLGIGSQKFPAIPTGPLTLVSPVVFAVFVKTSDGLAEAGVVFGVQEYTAKAL